MDWHQTGDKCLSEQMMIYQRIYASLGLDELQAQRGFQPIFVCRLCLFENAMISVYCINYDDMDKIITPKAFVLKKRFTT